MDSPTPRQLLKVQVPFRKLPPEPPRTSEKSLHELFQSGGWLEDCLTRESIRANHSQLRPPDPPILAFFDFFAFFVFRFSLLFLAFCLPFPRILGVPRREKPLLFWGKTLAFSKKARFGGSGPIFFQAVLQGGCKFKVEKAHFAA